MGVYLAEANVEAYSAVAVDWAEPARRPKETKVRILMGNMGRPLHPLIQCLKTCVRVLPFGDNAEHFFYVLGPVGKVTGACASHSFLPYEEDDENSSKRDFSPHDMQK